MASVNDKKGLASIIDNVVKTGIEAEKAVKKSKEEAKKADQNSLDGQTASPTPASNPSSSVGSGSGSGSASKAQSAKRTAEIAKANAAATTQQLDRQLENYDYANELNRRLADLERIQNSRQLEDDRFNANRDLQSSALGILGSMNQAMNGSTVQNLMSMLENRNDRDNVSYWSAHQKSNDQVENAYEESVNQNEIAARDAIISAEKALRDQESDLSANLNNIDSGRYAAPGTGDANLGAADLWEKYMRPRTEADRYAQSRSGYSGTGYVMPDNSVQEARAKAPRNRLTGNDYFSNMMNRFNGR